MREKKLEVEQSIGRNVDLSELAQCVSDEWRVSIVFVEYYFYVQTLITSLTTPQSQFIGYCKWKCA